MDKESKVKYSVWKDNSNLKSGEFVGIRTLTKEEADKLRQEGYSLYDLKVDWN